MTSDTSYRDGIDPCLIPLLGNDNDEQNVALLSTCKSFMHTIMEWNDTRDLSVRMMRDFWDTMTDNMTLAQKKWYPGLQQQDYSTAITFTTLLFPCPKKSYSPGTDGIVKHPLSLTHLCIYPAYDGATSKRSIRLYHTERQRGSYHQLWRLCTKRNSGQR